MLPVLPAPTRILLLAFALGATSACETDVAYAPCDFDPDIEEVCFPPGDDFRQRGSFTCAVTDHPECPERVCLSHLGSTAYCTGVCEQNADCPRNGTCEAVLTSQGEQNFCIFNFGEL